MSNGLHNGLDNGLHNGLYYGHKAGQEEGLFENEKFIIKDVIKDGLQLYLDFSNPKCYNYGQGQIGNTIYNLVQNNKNLIIQNLTGRDVANAPYVDYTPIAHWNNYTLNYINQSYMTSPNNTDFDLGLNGMTLSMWVNIPIANTDYTSICCKSFLGHVIGRWLFYFRNAWGIGFFTQTAAGNTDIVSANNVLVPDKWHYISAVFDRINGIKLYVDNVLVASASLNTVGENLTVSQPFHIGMHSQNYSGSGGRFKGNYMTYYNRALSVNELTYNYVVTKRYISDLMVQ